MGLLDTLDGEIQEEEQLSVKKDLCPVEDAGDYVIVRDIECTDADGNVFEYHKELWIPKDVWNPYDRPFNLYDEVVHFQEIGSGWFLPSAALTLNYLLKILPAAVNKRSNGTYGVINEEFKKVLDRHCNYWCLQNSLIDYKTNEIMHYPKTHSSSYINAGRSNARLSFDKSELRSGFIKLETGLKNKGIERFVRQYSGLIEPERLVELGDYYSSFPEANKFVSLYFEWHNLNEKYASSSVIFIGRNAYDLSLVNGGFAKSVATCGVRSI